MTPFAEPNPSTQTPPPPADAGSIETEGESTAEPPSNAAATQGGFRSFVEGLVCLALAVVLFRTFHLEGYMISTGSMAPSLYGYHKRVVCPSCHYVFAHGVAYDASVPGAAKGDDGFGFQERSTCSCPNCGQYGIDVTDVPRNQGDQLLVHKHAYVFQRPRRWEVVVFRNPNDSGEAYVKRIVGLPGERIQVRNGDVYIDGRIERKDLYTQHAIRIPVYDHDHAPTDDRWHDRWVVALDGGWTAFDGTDDDPTHGFHFDPTTAIDVDPESNEEWLTYRHWVRGGGAHETSVEMDGWPTDAALPDGSFLAVRYDSRTNRLSCMGAMSDTWRDRMLAASTDERFRTAIHELYRRSHVAPINDFYGYNRSVTGVQPQPVRDIAFAARLAVPVPEGRVVVRMTDGRHDFDWIVDYTTGRTQLVVDGDEATPVRDVPIPPVLTGDGVDVEMTTFDRRVIVAVDGEPVFDPWDVPEVGDVDEELEFAGIREPVRIRVTGGRVSFTHLQLYRDVHYTRGRAVNGVDEPFALADDEYFALGDNSPVSFDSRSWPSPAVPERLLLGKPLVVHLPSKPGRIRLGNREAHIRIPDFSRIRYVR